jgi:hypothetical protein
LQSTINLGHTSSWAAVTLQAPPAIVDGQYRATIPNAFTNTQQFFRLSGSITGRTF